MSRQASGLQAWALQRLTAVFLACYLLYFVISLLLDTPSNYQQWHAWLITPSMSMLTYVAILSLLLHAWIGIRDVMIDYIKPALIKIMLLACILIYLVGCGIWAGKLLLLAELSVS